MAEWEHVFKQNVGLSNEHPRGVELQLIIRNPDTFQMHNVKAIIHQTLKDYPDADRLYYTSATGGREKEPVPIQILEFVKAKTEDVHRLPTQKLTLGQRKGKMLMDMIKDRKK